MKLKNLFPQKLKNFYHLWQAILANLFFSFPGKKLKIIGVTGTNGKTTTVQMIVRILEEAGYQVAAASTINFKLGKKEWTNRTKFTTLSAWTTQRFLKEALKEKCDYVVLEISSHSLDQFRVWGIRYEVAVITNISREHLDYHKTLENYRQVKSRLFSSAKKSVVNLGMERPEEFLNLGTGLRFGFLVSSSNFQLQGQSIKVNFNDSENLLNDRLKKVVALELKIDPEQTSFKLDNSSFTIYLPGKFNVENALAAVAVGKAEGISLEIMRKALERIKNIPGRMERVKNNLGLNIIIDYAVTPDSLEKIYSLIRELNKNNQKIISVFGACGERDRGKRPIMGEIVANFCDIAIVTNEDPYDEDPQRIINEVFEGVVNPRGRIQPSQKSYNFFKEGVNCFRILDRREAIRKALELAQTGDFVVITGKGAEETIAIGKRRLPWKEKAIIEEELKGIKKH